MGKQGRGKTSPILGAHPLPSAGDLGFGALPRADGLGVLGVLVRMCTTLVEWLLKGREVGCLPKDAKKLLVERCRWVA